VRWSNSLALHPPPLLLLLAAANIIKEDRCRRPSSLGTTVAVKRFPYTAVMRISPPSPPLTPLPL
jgi:hypothetical protein